MISLVQSNGSPNFHIFLSYGPHQRLKFGLIAVFSLPNNMNGLDCDYQAHNVRNITSNGSRFYANISRFKKDQRLKFGHVAVLDLLHICKGVDHGCGSHKVSKN
eukprot:TRINITY_DN14368_c0_g1_i2.p1 TRINITY_DN14368_c0_g1~~TRINITY_DN14368_c0_g1_i2.p1  ORF type:complete len:104 (+),score=5.69 TRINITY_DN14368_c0_g1_i2:316-627(+)